MLPEVVLAVENAGFRAFVVAGAVVVCCEMFAARIKFIAIDAFRLARRLIGDDFSNWRTQPLLE